MTDPRAATEALLQARRSRDWIAVLPDGARPQDEAEAYAIQDAVAAALAPEQGGIAAWKVGAANPEAPPFAAPILVAPRQTGREYDVDTHGDTLFIHTNDTDPMWRLVTAPISAPGSWTELIAPSPHFYMTGVECFADFFIVEGREDGLDQIEIHD